MLTLHEQITLHEQYRFECNCITGHGRSNGTRYKCEGKFTNKIELLQLNFRRNID